AFPSHIGPRRRPSSYSDSTLAWPAAHVPPPVSGDASLPSILMGRPSRCLTTRPQAALHAPQVVAYRFGTPGTISMEAAGSGTACWTGARHPAPSPRAPSEQPINDSTSRRGASNPVERVPVGRPICTKGSPSASRGAASSHVGLRFMLASPSVVAARAVLARERRRPIADVRGDACERAGRDVRLGAVAAEAPAHRQRRRLLDAVHLFDRAVAALAGDARDDVLAVIEVDEVRQVVDLRPDDRAALLDRLLQALDLRRLLLDQRVAV